MLVPQWEDALTAAIAARLGVSADDDLRPRLLAGVGLATLTAVGRVWMASDGTAEIDALLRHAFDALVAAVDEERA